MSADKAPEAPSLNRGKHLVIGGAGSIGSEIVDQLVTAGAERVTVLDNLVRGRRSNITASLDTGRVELVEGDIRDRALVRELVDGPGGVDTVFNQAATPITQCADDPRLAVDVMVNGTINVLEAIDKVGKSATAAARGTRAPKLVAASSASVHEMAEVLPMGERHRAHNNHTAYGASKMPGDKIVASFRNKYGLDYVIMRYVNVYGPYMDVHGKYAEVLVRWMERIDDGLPPLIYGDGSNAVDFVTTEDVTRANLLAAVSPITAGVYHVASGTEVSLQDLAEALLRVMGSDLPVEYVTERTSKSVERQLADTSAVARDLGFHATIGLDEGLHQLVEWWRSLRVGVATDSSHI
ncbi:NAD-dependent epimerase/dehydratase family protein [Citricoccus sp. NPDC055426]|uniref:NAD-dependent epimerase/dehydratase family protein n=1 Tax=Citricoccus sp. NPDC055426 TaxID=3155536 RepID=UPI0034169A50